MFSDVEIADRPAAAAIEKPTERKVNWLPLSATILAILAAISSVFAAKSANEAILSRNDASLIRLSASDSYTAYEAHAVREQIYEAQLAANPRLPKGVHDALFRVAELERIAKQPLLAQAQSDEQRAADESERSQRYADAFDLLEIGAVLFEIGIALVGIEALASSPTWLAVFSAMFAVAGVFFEFMGFAKR